MWSNMAVEIAGFAQALARCHAFAAIDAGELENVLASGKEPLEMLVVDPSADEPLIRSGSPFKRLYFVQHGIIVPWQYPHTELSSPFLIGDHEFMMEAGRWVASYSAATEVTVVGIPVDTMGLVVERIPGLRAQMSLVLLRRIARYYWVSLATNGSPAPRVAATLISRLALNGEDFGGEREISIRQGDIVRLTAMSRSAVASGISRLASTKVIHLGTNSERFAGLIYVPDVDRLKDYALSEVREKQVRPLLRSNQDYH